MLYIASSSLVRYLYYALPFWHNRLVTVIEFQFVDVVSRFIIYYIVWLWMLLFWLVEEVAWETFPHQPQRTFVIIINQFDIVIELARVCYLVKVADTTVITFQSLAVVAVVFACRPPCFCSNGHQSDADLGRTSSAPERTLYPGSAPLPFPVDRLPGPQWGSGTNDAHPT